MILLIKSKRKINKKNCLYIEFVIYCLFLIYVLFINKNFRNNFQMVNLKPFVTIQRYIKAVQYNYINPSIAFINLIANLILFVPMGFFLLILFEDKIKNIFVFSSLNFLIIVSIEYIQYITSTGSADIDDIILNMIGIFFSYIFMKNKKIKKFLLNKLLI